MIRSLTALGLGVAVSLATVAAAPRTTVVDLGGIREYVRADAATPLAGLELFVRAGLARQTTAQNGMAALVAEALLHEPVPSAVAGQPPIALSDAVTARGGSLSYAISSQYARFYLEAQADALPGLATLVARTFSAAAFEPEVLAAARTALGERIADNQRDPRLVGVEMLRGSYYRDGAGMPVLGTTASIATIGSADAKAFFTRWYLRGDALVAAVGNTGTATDDASRKWVNALPAGSAPATQLGVRPISAQPKRLVTRRDVFAPYVVLGFAAPALGDRDFAAALVVRSLLGDVFESQTTPTGPTIFRPTGAIYGYDTVPAQFVVWVNGSRVDPSVALAAIDGVLKSAALKPMAPSVLSRFKQIARGQWQLENLSLDERAFAVGNAVSLGVDADIDDSIADAVNRVTAADVQRVVKRYFQRFEVALVLPRQGGGTSGS